MDMIKQLILVRHAHRDTSDRNQDNGLSAKGLKQAKWLRRFAADRFDKKEWKDLRGRVLSSPKRRCLESVAPISELFELPCETHNDLEEQKSGESFAQFNDRIHHFLDWWVKDGPSLVVACSHGDWLPLAIFHVLGTSIEMKKGSWLELEWENGRAQLRWYVPSFKAIYDV
jgi:broad specificity phosphatase PhoE